MLALQTSRPVKIVYSRQEEFACLSPRQSTQTRVRHGCDEQGRLTFRQIDVLQDNGAYTSWGATFPTVMMIPATSLYRVPNVRFHATLVYTNNTYCQAMRGYGNPEVTWAIESNLDDLARRAGIDPLELRRINCNEPGETTPMGLKVSTCGLRQCLDRTGERLGWEERRGEVHSDGESDADGDTDADTKHRIKYRGVGLASLIHVGGSGRIYRSDASGIILKLDDYGNVNVYYGGVEMGQGLHSALTLGIAERLGVRPEMVVINPTDTGTCPWDVGTHASRGAFVALNAAIMAADKARAKLFAMAEEIFPAEVERALAKRKKKDPDFTPPDLDLRAMARRGAFELYDGVLRLREAPDDPLLQLPLDRMLRAMHFREQGDMLTVEAFYDPPNELPDWAEGRGTMSATYAYGTQGVEVEVDTETGEVTILKLVAAHDVGQVLNPQTLAGQTYGALAQGLGYALTEQVLTQGGRILNPSFRDYKLPTACELNFPIELEFIETHDGFGPFGAKGVGEPGLVPTAPAIGNAIYDAVGVRIYDLPITPEKVLAALQSREG